MQCRGLKGETGIETQEISASIAFTVSRFYILIFEVDGRYAVLYYACYLDTSLDIIVACEYLMCRG